jgi:hypothetical protein
VRHGRTEIRLAEVNARVVSQTHHALRYDTQPLSCTPFVSTRSKLPMAEREGLYRVATLN